MKNLYTRYFIKTFLLLFLYVYNDSDVFAWTYYVSSSSGDDGRTLVEARSVSMPWRTLGKVSAMSGLFQAGDQVLFKRGDIFTGVLTIGGSGASGRPIVFGAYGEGALPELTGFARVTGWQQKGGNVWEAVVPAGLSYLNTVTVRGAGKAPGRWPNAGAANGGYASYEGYNGNSSVTDSKLSSQPNWTGGQIVMRKNRWIIDRNEISGQSGTTVSYRSASGYGGARGYGYFIQNHPGTLDTEGEWYYSAGSKKLGIFSAGSPEGYTVRAGVTETLVRVTDQSNLSFENLRLSGATASAFAIVSSQNIRISSCEVLFSGRNALDANGTEGLIVENTLIAHTGNNACNVNGSGTVLRGNRIRSTGIDAGMGEGGDGTYEGVLISGDNNLVINNTIDSTGYIPLTFNGNNVTVKNNVVSNFALTKDDGGGIYTWNNGPNAPQNSGRVITGNIVLNGTGAPGGTDSPDKRYAHGIYIDDGAGQVEITGNTVANCATFGVYIHNAHDIVVKQNTLYNNATQLFMEHDNIAADKLIYNCMVTGNVLFAKQVNQLSAEYKTKDNDINNFGMFEGNYYYRPLDNDLVIGVLQQVNGVYSYQGLSLESWKALYGKDAGSVRSAHTVPSYTISKVTGSNQFSNGSFEGNAGGQYAYASANNCSTGWDSGTLDGGALRVSFSSASGSTNYGSVIMGIGGVTAGRGYRLKFSMLGGNGHKAVTAYLRQSGGGYSDLSDRKSATIGSTRTENEFVFTARASEGNASLVFDVPEQPSPLYLDNLVLEAVEAEPTNPDQYLSFFFNPTNTTETYSVNPGSDVYDNNYQNNINIEPFQSTIILKNSSTKCCLVPLPKPIIVAN